MTKDGIDAKTLRDMLENGENVTVVEVRRAEDHPEWSVPGSVNLAAYDELKAGNPDAPEDRPVVTVCGLGRSSAVAADSSRGGVSMPSPWRAA